ncbi:MAG: PD-(D/E)XK nuclease family protein, partial [Solirubrobacteraceae bacterium]
STEAPPTAALAGVAPTAVLPVAMLSYSSLERHAECGYRYYLQKVLGLAPDARAWAAAETGLPGVVRGTLVHGLLEHLDFAAPVLPSEAEVRALIAGTGTEPADADVADIVGLVGAFAGSALCGRLARAAPVRREAGFVFSLSLPGRERLLVNGFIDAIGHEGERALVVDYKSDRRVGDGDLETHVETQYGTQRLVYALAALQGGAAEVEVVHVVLERPGEPVSARFTAAELPQLEAQLASLARGILEEHFTVTPAPNLWTCQGCPGRAALCSYDLEQTGREPGDPEEASPEPSSG